MELWVYNRKRPRKLFLYSCVNLLMSTLKNSIICYTLPCWINPSSNINFHAMGIGQWCASIAVMYWPVLVFYWFLDKFFENSGSDFSIFFRDVGTLWFPYWQMILCTFMFFLFCSVCFRFVEYISKYLFYLNISFTSIPSNLIKYAYFKQESCRGF